MSLDASPIIYISSDMDNSNAAAAFAALGHESRLAILQFLVECGTDGADASTMSAELGIPWTTLSHHLDHLKRTGLVRAEREGRRLVHTAEFAAVQRLSTFLLRNCCSRQTPSETRSEDHGQAPARAHRG